jgi:hypothetical protein
MRLRRSASRPAAMAMATALAFGVLPSCVAGPLPLVLLVLEPGGLTLARGERQSVSAMTCPDGEPSHSGCVRQPVRWRVTDGNRLIVLDREEGPTVAVTAGNRAGTAEVTATWVRRNDPDQVVSMHVKVVATEEAPPTEEPASTTVSAAVLPTESGDGVVSLGYTRSETELDEGQRSNGPVSMTERPGTNTNFAVDQMGGLWVTHDGAATWSQRTTDSDLAGGDWHLASGTGSRFLHAVSAGGEARRVNVLNGNVVEVPTIAYEAGDPREGRRPVVGAIAADLNADAMFAIDVSAGTLARWDPGTGAATTVGPVGVDLDGELGLAQTVDGVLLLSVSRSDPPRTEVFSLDPGTAAATHAMTLPFGNARITGGAPGAGGQPALRRVTEAGLETFQLMFNQARLTGDFGPDTLAAVAAQPFNDHAVVLDRTGSIWLTDPASGVSTWVPTDPLPSGPWTPLVQGGTLALVGGSGERLNVDLSSGTVTERPAVAYVAHDPNAGVTPSIVAAAHDPAGERILAVDAAAGALAAVDAETGEAQTVGPLPMSPEGIASVSVLEDGNAVVFERRGPGTTEGLPMIEATVLDPRDATSVGQLAFVLPEPSSGTTEPGAPASVELPRVAHPGSLDLGPPFEAPGRWNVAFDATGDLLNPATGQPVAAFPGSVDVTAAYWAPVTLTDEQARQLQERLAADIESGDRIGNAHPLEGGDWIAVVLQTVEAPQEGSSADEQGFQVATFATPTEQDAVLRQAAHPEGRSPDVGRGTTNQLELGRGPGNITGQARRDYARQRMVEADFPWFWGSVVLMVPADQVGPWFTLAVFSSDGESRAVDVVLGPGTGTPGIPSNGSVTPGVECASISVHPGASEVVLDIGYALGPDPFESVTPRLVRADDQQRGPETPMTRVDGLDGVASWRADVAPGPGRYAIELGSATQDEETARRVADLVAETDRLLRGTTFMVDGVTSGPIAGDPTCAAGKASSVGGDRLPGDYNEDGRVDGMDLLEWLGQRGARVEPGTGADGNGDGVVDDADLEVWRDHFGRGRG